MTAREVNHPNRRYVLKFGMVNYHPILLNWISINKVLDVAKPLTHAVCGDELS